MNNIVHRKRGRPPVKSHGKPDRTMAVKLAQDECLFYLLAFGLLKLEPFVLDFITTMPNMAFLFKIREICRKYGFQSPAFTITNSERGRKYLVQAATIFFVRTERPDWIPKPTRDTSWWRETDEIANSGKTYIYINFSKDVHDNIIVTVGGSNTNFGGLDLYSNTKRETFFDEIEDGENYGYFTKNKPSSNGDKTAIPKYKCGEVRFAYRLDENGLKAFLEDLETTLAYHKYCEENDFYPY